VALKPNLAGARLRLEALMGTDDEPAAEVVVTGSVEGEGTFDRESLEWSIEAAPILYDGRCLISSRTPDRYFDVGDVQNLRGEWKLTVPSGTDEFPNGSEVEIFSCARDPGIEGRRFRIERRRGGTFKICPSYDLVEFEPVSRELP
jgi:hypothetical protein